MGHGFCPVLCPEGNMLPIIVYHSMVCCVMAMLVPVHPVRVACHTKVAAVAPNRLLRNGPPHFCRACYSMLPGFASTCNLAQPLKCCIAACSVHSLASQLMG